MEPIQQSNFYASSPRHHENFEPNLPLILVVGLAVLGVLANVNLDDPEGLRLRARVQNTTGLLIVCAIGILAVNILLNTK